MSVSFDNTVVKNAHKKARASRALYKNNKIQFPLYCVCFLKKIPLGPMTNVMPKRGIYCTKKFFLYSSPPKENKQSSQVTHVSVRHHHMICFLIMLDFLVCFGGKQKQRMWTYEHNVFIYTVRSTITKEEPKQKPALEKNVAVSFDFAV